MENNSTRNPELLEIGELTYQWLSALKQRVNKEFVKSEIAAHPDYPALTSIIDLLDEGKLEYCARRADITEAKEFNYPCIVHLSLPDGSKGLFQINSPAELEISKPYWNGIVLYTSIGSKWQHPVNNELMKVGKTNRYSFLVFACLLFLATITACFFSYSFAHAVFLLSSGAGILVSILIIAQELGIASESVQKICGINSNKNGCASVLSSKYAKSINGISVAEIAAAYFVGQWMIFWFATWIPVIAIISETITTIAIGSVLIGGWSVYLQKNIVKQWCAFCLGIVAVLALQCIVASTQEISVTAIGIVCFAAMIFLALAVVHPVKMLLEKLRGLDAKKRELHRWKKDAYLFMQQLENEHPVDCSPFEEELELANPNGVIQFTIACNPYCVPCAVTHRQIDKLIDAYGDDISVKVRFAINAADQNNEQTVAANLIINTSMESKITRRAVYDWFSMMDAKTFLEKWPLKNDESNFELLKKHELWTEIARIEHTPTIFINGKKLPKRYAADDLMLIIPELYDQLMEN